MKLNLGCGFRKKEGFTNVDRGTFCEPDVVVDLVKERWPWDDGTVEAAAFEFSLEQMGTKPEDLEHVFKELYRVCKADAQIDILALHPRHDEFLLNPMYTQRLGPEFVSSLSVSKNMTMIAQGNYGNSMGMFWEVNFEMENFRALLDRKFEPAMKDPDFQNAIMNKIQFENNIIHSMEFTLKKRA